MQRGEILYCTDSEDDPRVDREACRGVGLRSMIVVPLRHEGETVDMPEGGRAIVQRIKNEIAPPLHFEGQTFPLSASIGVTAFPDDGHDIDTLLHAADQRMYRVKGARQASRPACVDAPGEASAAVWQRRADA